MRINTSPEKLEFQRKIHNSGHEKYFATYMKTIFLFVDISTEKNVILNTIFFFSHMNAKMESSMGIKYMNQNHRHHQHINFTVLQGYYFKW